MFFRHSTKIADIDNTGDEAGEISIRIVRSSSHSTVSVAGRVTVDSSSHLRSVLLEMLRRGAGPVLLIDLFGVSYLDMSGLATLLEALQAAQRQAVKLRVLGMTGQSRLLAELTELDKVFETGGSEVQFR